MSDFYIPEMTYPKSRDFSFMIDYTQALVNLQKGSVQMKSEMKSLNTVGKTEFILFDLCSQTFFISNIIIYFDFSTSKLYMYNKL